MIKAQVKVQINKVKSSVIKPVKESRTNSPSVHKGGQQIRPIASPQSKKVILANNGNREKSMIDSMVLHHNRGTEFGSERNNLNMIKRVHKA